MKIIICAVLCFLTFLSSSSLSFAMALEADNEGNYIINGQTQNALSLLKDFVFLRKLNLYLDDEATKVLDGDVFILGKKSWSPEQLEKLIYNILKQNKLAVIKNKNDKQIKIVATKNIRYVDLPLYHEQEKKPETGEYISQIYSTKFIDAKTIERIFRPFLTKAGRIKSNSHSNFLLMKDNARNLQSLLKIIQEVDTKEINDAIKEQSEINEELKKIAMPSVSLNEKIEKHFILFIVLFSILFAVIGFMFRGFVIRKIEGGL